jgi:hypothetical protein
MSPLSMSCDSETDRQADETDRQADETGKELAGSPALLSICEMCAVGTTLNQKGRLTQPTDSMEKKI